MISGRLVRAMVIAVACVATVVAQEPPKTETDLLAEARRLYDSAEHAEAVPLLSEAIARLEQRPRTDPAASSLLAGAYELRGRARLLGERDVEGAKADFKSLLTVAPGHTLWQPVNERISSVFAEVRGAIVGEILVSLTPPDAELQLDGRPFTPTTGPVAVVAGSHTLSAARPGYQPVTETFVVAPGMKDQAVAVTLPRVSATVAVLTVPAGVEVRVDGVTKGTTEEGPAPAHYSAAAERLNEPLERLSKPLLLADLAPGKHTLEFRRECYRRTEFAFTVREPADYLTEAKLEPAAASVFVNSEISGATVYLDGVAKGSVPRSLDGICEGEHTIEVRSGTGRFVKRLEIRAGETQNLLAELKPAVAIIAASGAAENVRGARDLRRDVERVLGDAATVAFFAPPPADAQRILDEHGLANDWLAFTPDGRPASASASTSTPAAQIYLSTRLSRAVDAQGVATVTVPPAAEAGRVLVSLLAAGSGRPDVLDVNLDVPASKAPTLRQLTETRALFRSSIGAVTIDVADVAGVVIASVDPSGPAAVAGVRVGDVLTHAKGQPTSSVAAFNAVLAGIPTGERIVLQGRDAAGAPREASVQVVAMPRLVSMDDRTVLFNKLVIDLRDRIARAAGTPEETFARLNLAVALMAVENFREAREQLEQVKLPRGRGVSYGTVQYLLGLCYERLDLPVEAERAWKEAAASPDSTLTDDGGSVAELAAGRLKAPQPTRRPTGQTPP